MNFISCFGDVFRDCSFINCTTSKPLRVGITFFNLMVYSNSIRLMLKNLSKNLAISFNTDLLNKEGLIVMSDGKFLKPSPEPNNTTS